MFHARISAICISLCLTTITTLGLAQPTIGSGGILNGASFRYSGAPGGGIAAGSIISIFGGNLATSTAVANSLPLPNTLGGTSVTIGGTRAPLFFVSAGQINAQVPWSTPAGSQPVVVTSNGTVGAAMNVTVQTASPGIFAQTSDGRGPGAIQNFVSQGSTPLNNAATSIAPGGLVIIYATGLGAVTSPPADGAAGSGQTTQNAVTVRIANQTVSPEFAGLAPGFVGLNQVNVRLPANLAVGCHISIQLLVAGQASNTVTLSVANTANCTTLPGELAPLPNSNYGTLGLVRGNLITAGQTQAYNTLSAAFLKYGPVAAAPLIAPSAGGGCIVDFFANTSGISTFPDFTGGVAARLDAGQVTFNPPGGSTAVIINPVNGTYATQTGVSVLSGAAEIKLGGGRDVSTFTATYNVPGGFSPTTSLGVVNTTFSQGLGITANWSSCPDPTGTVIVGAFSFDPRNTFQATGYCSVACSAGTFRLGPEVLSLLPLNTAAGAGICVGMIGTPVKFSSPGLNAGYFTFLDFTSFERLNMLP